MPRLIISAPDGKRGILELNQPVVTIGRGNANDLVLNDSSISRFHAVIKLSDNTVVIADRGSTNGVVLNGQRITAETEMKRGDVAVLGPYQVRLERMDDKGIQVRKAEIPSTIEHIIHGGGERIVTPEKITATDSALADLIQRIK